MIGEIGKERIIDADGPYQENKQIMFDTPHPEFQRLLDKYHIGDTRLENYQKIKPESVSLTSEVNDFWKSEFQKEAELRTEKHYDDNGKLYRLGDILLPETEYEVNGYKYKTDAEGRIVSAEGKLRMRDSDYDRKMEEVRDIEGQDYRQGDDRGHLIGHQFGGSDRLENLVPMDAKLNHGDFVKLEKTLADAVKDKADVRLKVEPVYEDDSGRPSEFKVSYSIDGDRETVVFRNERED